MRERRKCIALYDGMLLQLLERPVSPHPPGAGLVFKSRSFDVKIN